MLEVKNLNIKFQDQLENDEVVSDISFQMEDGEILAIVGESGSGKSMTALSIIGLQKSHAMVSGEILLDNINLLALDKKKRRAYMGKRIAMIFQEPMTSLNPVMKVGLQVEEILRLHQDSTEKMNRKERKEKVIEMFQEVDLKNPQELYDKYPHELSGGMRQRVMIAIAVILKPNILIADEPTTALDAQTQSQILQLLLKINKHYHISILMISHDLYVVSKMASRVIVMNAGKIVEFGKTQDIINNPQMEYTKKLIASIPTGKKIPTEHKKEVLISAKDLSIYYQKGKKKNVVINQMNFEIYKGEILGLVGKSGLGKTTISKTILGIHKKYTGMLSCNATRSQMIFQDPFQSLNPSKRIGWILEEPLKIMGMKDKTERRKKVDEMLVKVGLSDNYKERFPYELSGGQRQRVSIALALISDADFIIADEPVSALDVTIQAQILELLLELQKEYQITMLFISHDIHVIEKMCDRIIEL